MKIFHLEAIWEKKLLKISKMRTSKNQSKITQGTNLFSHGSLTTKTFTSSFSFLYV